MFFQRDCLRSEAHYQLQANGKVAVTNRCETEDGQWQEAKGEAVPQQAGRTDRLWVRFDNWFGRLFPDLTKGHYWVLYLDEGYSTAPSAAPTANISGCWPAMPRSTRRRAPVCSARPNAEATTPLS